MLLLVAMSGDAHAQREPHLCIKDIVYSCPNHKNLKMRLYLPEAGEKSNPAVLLIHGGAWIGGWRGLMDWYGKRLAEKGYVAASIGYRRMPKYGFPECLYDCKAAVRYLRLNAVDLNIDPDRIGVLGNSAGGHLAAMLATTPDGQLEGPDNPGPSTEVQAAVIMYGVFDLNYYRRPKGYIRLFGFTTRFIRAFVADAPAGPYDSYDAASPATYLGPHVCPMLLVHGKKDKQVPYAQSETVYNQLNRLGVEAQLITVKYGHAFDYFHHKTRKKVFDQILNFLDRHLKDTHETNP